MDNSNNEECTSCPICLESLFVVPEVDTSSSSSTTTNTTTMMMVGTTVPCGHCLHVQCWDEWMATTMNHQNNRNNKRSVTTKCPLCNIKTTSFVRLFLNIPNQQSQQQQLSSSYQSNTMNDNDDSDVWDTDDDENDDDENDNNIIDIDDDDNDHDNENAYDEAYHVRYNKRIKTNDTSTTIDSNKCRFNNITKEKKNVYRMKYRKMKHKLSKEKEQIETKYNFYYNEYITIRKSLQNKINEYNTINEMYIELQQTTHKNQLKMDGIVLQNIQYQNDIKSLQQQIQKLNSTIQAKQESIKTLQQQHQTDINILQKQSKLNNQNQLCEINTILKERPKLLQQIHTYQQTIQQLHKQQSNNNSEQQSKNQSQSIPSKSTINMKSNVDGVVASKHTILNRSTTTTSSTTSNLFSKQNNNNSHQQHKKLQHKQLLRTLSEQIDQNHPNDVPLRRNNMASNTNQNNHTNNNNKSLPFVSIDINRNSICSSTTTTTSTNTTTNKSHSYNTTSNCYHNNNIIDNNKNKRKVPSTLPVSQQQQQRHLTKPLIPINNNKGPMIKYCTTKK